MSLHEIEKRFILLKRSLFLLDGHFTRHSLAIPELTETLGEVETILSPRVWRSSFQVSSVMRNVNRLVVRTRPRPSHLQSCKSA